jgi:N-acetylmuramoyl-L-alanine amidase
VTDRVRIVRLLACALTFASLGCGSRRHEAAPASSASAGTLEASVLGTRPEVVAKADELAVAGSRASGAEAATLFARAAELRTRLWRIDGREADALEALELYSSVADTAGELGCSARVDRALLEGELRADPSATYRALYGARVLANVKACKERADRALAVLAAWRPLPNVLTEIERQARADAGAAGVLEPSPATVRIDANGPVVVPTLSGQSTGPARITSIERYGAKDQARIVVLITRPTVFDVGFIPAEDRKNPRLYVDIDGASYKGPLDYTVGGLVERVRLGKRGKSTRVVLDLTKAVYRKVFYLPEPFRLVIDVSTEPPASAIPADAAATGPRPVRRVVLDPGHGGHDPGAVGPGGLQEKDVTLDVAHRAAPILARELGVTTLLTRDGDDFVPLDARTARGNAFGGDLFISIHCNASPDPAARGYMTFVLADGKDAFASSVAARENAASAAAAAELANVMSRVLDAGSVSRSVELAELLQRATGASFATSYADAQAGGVKRAGFYVLAGARMPAVLFETSFISNPMEESRLNTNDYRQKLADAIVNAVRAYREGK